MSAEYARIERDIRWGDAKRYCEEWLGEVHSSEKDVVAAALLNLLDENERLERELAATKKYAEEGWAWLDDALAALGVKTVFDIPKSSAPKPNERKDE